MRMTEEQFEVLCEMFGAMAALAVNTATNDRLRINVGVRNVAQLEEKARKLFVTDPAAADEAVAEAARKAAEPAPLARAPISGPLLEKFYITKNDGGAVFVKEGAFFESQGGLTADWGKTWREVYAADLASARAMWRPEWDNNEPQR